MIWLRDNFNDLIAKHAPKPGGFGRVAGEDVRVTVDELPPRRAVHSLRNWAVDSPQAPSLATAGNPNRCSASRPIGLGPGLEA